MYTYYKDAAGSVYAYTDAQTPLEGLTPISEKEKNERIEAKQAAAFERRSYAQKRKAEYPPIEDYIDGVVKGDAAQIAAYIQACLSVKDKYPKG